MLSHRFVSLELLKRMCYSSGTLAVSLLVAAIFVAANPKGLAGWISAGGIVVAALVVAFAFTKYTESFAKIASAQAQSSSRPYGPDMSES